MSNLVAIAYPDRATAEQVRDTLMQMSTERVIELDDLVVASRDPDGKVKLHQSSSPTGIAAAGGALWGGMIGLLFLAPVIGIAVGAASGALAGKLSDVGVDDSFMKDLGARLSQGSAAVIVLVRRSTPDKVLQGIAPYGGEVIQSSLSTEAEDRLRAALGGAVTA